MVGKDINVMLYLTYLVFALVLGMVPFSVALNSSVYRCIEWKETFRIALVLALFMAMATGIGGAIGYGLKGLFFSMKVPVALFIILLIAFRLFMDSRRRNKEIRIIVSEHNRILISFGIVISINPMLLGISLGILYSGVLYLTGFIFGMVFLLTVIGIRLGKLGWLNLGRTAELAGSFALFITGVIILLQYLKMI